MTDKPPFNKRQSADSKPDYTISDSNDLQSVHIQFSGQFNNKKIIWDANIITLTEYYRQLLQTQPWQKGGIELKQFIEISETRKNSIPLRVALNVNEITRPVILKTIIMIHNYKRLRPGRQEYGPGVIFAEKYQEPVCKDC